MQPPGGLGCQRSPPGPGCWEPAPGTAPCNQLGAQIRAGWWHWLKGFGQNMPLLCAMMLKRWAGILHRAQCPSRCFGVPSIVQNPKVILPFASLEYQSRMSFAMTDILSEDRAGTGSWQGPPDLKRHLLGGIAEALHPLSVARPCRPPGGAAHAAL